MDLLASIGFWSGAALCLPSFFLLLEVLAGLAELRPLPAHPDGVRGVILIPAHNEREGIVKLLATLSQTETKGLRAVVIADNCDDETADLARAAGAEVLERKDPNLRGKPHALHWALQQLAGDPPEVVLILDADCWFTSGSPTALAAQAKAAGRPVQGVYRMEGKGMQAFAFRFRNEARLRGLHALGGPVQLTGSGFALPWSSLEQVPVPVGELAEDAIWGWNFCRAGLGVRLASEISVASTLPATAEGERTQRRRWEHGILGAFLTAFPSLLRSSLFPPRWRRLLHLGDTLVPPLALLLLLILCSGGVALLSGSPGSVWPAGFALSAAGMAVFVGWIVYGREHLPFIRLLLAPWHALRKAGIYFSFLFRRERTWVRTRRDGDKS